MILEVPSNLVFYDSMSIFISVLYDLMPFSKRNKACINLYKIKLILILLYKVCVI